MAVLPSLFISCHLLLFMAGIISSTLSEKAFSAMIFSISLSVTGFLMAQVSIFATVE